MGKKLLRVEPICLDDLIPLDDSDVRFGIILGKTKLPQSIGNSSPLVSRVFRYYSVRNKTSGNVTDDASLLLAINKSRLKQTGSEILAGSQ
jgi:hypothetical protein